jgi:hypothetical protein
MAETVTDSAVFTGGVCIPKHWRKTIEAETIVREMPLFARVSAIEFWIAPHTWFLVKSGRALGERFGAEHLEDTVTWTERGALKDGIKRSLGVSSAPWIRAPLPPHPSTDPMRAPRQRHALRRGRGLRRQGPSVCDAGTPGIVGRLHTLRSTRRHSVAPARRGSPVPPPPFGYPRPPLPERGVIGHIVSPVSAGPAGGVVAYSSSSGRTPCSAK